MLHVSYSIGQTPSISVIIPSRGRPGLLGGLMRSFHDMTRHPQAIEVLIGYDHDDTDTPLMLGGLPYKWIRSFGRHRGNNISDDYFNWLLPKSRGRYILVLNDDCQLMTKNWDQILLKKADRYLNEHKDGIMYGWISDAVPPKWEFSCFPLVSRKATEVLGYLMHPGFPGWGADSYLWEVFNKVNRILPLREIFFRHISPHYDNRPPDDTNDSIRDKTKYTGLTTKVDVGKLRTYILGLNFSVPCSDRENSK